MTAVVHNQTLFQALVSCLKSTTECIESSSSTTSGGSHLNPTPTSGARKRNHSLDLSHIVSDVIPNKSMKLSHGQSPHVGKRMINAAASAAASSSYHNAKPQMNIRQLAATILYTALEPLDHWPVPLVEAYAEDCFGIRSWVDDPVCKLLVENLSLVHSGDVKEQQETMSSDNVENKIEFEADALMVAEFYQSQKSKNKTVNNVVASSLITSPYKISPKADAKRRGSLCSSASNDTGSVIPMAPSLSRQRSASFGSESVNSQPKPNGSSSPKKRPRISPQTKKAKSKSGDESDSGDEEEIALSTSLSKPSEDGDGSSSSSGEDEEVLMEERSIDGSEIAVEMSPKQDHGSTASDPPPPERLTYPVLQRKLKLSKVRQRYFGTNLEYAHLAVSEKLSERLEVKSKQNSGLLQCLPSFISIPNVRRLITANLEKWLQSPALSGLARSLFTITVNNMKNVDPPLEADLDTLDNVLSMRLKANQLNAHVENVTAIAARIPIAPVANHIYGHLLRNILVTMNSHESSFLDHLSMVHAVHDVLPDALRADGVASSLLGLLMKPPEALSNLTNPQLIRRIRTLIQEISKKFGSSFDAYQVLKAMMSYQVDSEYPWTILDEENKARIMFQCATLLVDLVFVTDRLQPAGKSIKFVGPTEEEVVSLKLKLRKARKLLLGWCCADYAPLCTSTAKQRQKQDELVGAGPPNYSSILDGIGGDSIPDWLSIIRCVLFMEPAGSSKMHQFLAPDNFAIEGEPSWTEEAKRISCCCDYGADLDDEMVWLVLRRATKPFNGVPHETALLILEHMFDCCKKDRKPELLLQDSDILWKLYDLVEYIPSCLNNGGTMSDGSNGDRDVKMADNQSGEDDPSLEISNDSIIAPRRQEISKLAYSGMWWRVTGIALIMCGVSPQIVGGTAWEQHPTLKALIKMVTSDRYRFPTVDCDETAREEQKKTEQEMRDEEAKITEMLFLPPKKPKKKKQPVDLENAHAGSRVSRRQQEKREKMLKRQKEKEKAEEQAEASRRKKTLRAAQKSIVLWDPKKGPRKPPKESADLIFSVGEAFDLPRVFQKNTQPDFVLSTIGSTSRGSIERAYDWLIPIISFLPETISRLPASASCFLLLRAYGTEGEERSQLQKLSAPLLEHVHDSLVGTFGEADAIRAFDLLLTDVSSHNPDRRRCARRVLQNAIGKESLGDDDSTFSGSNHAWVNNIIYVEHAKSILKDAVQHLATAASFERGSNLRYLVLALNKLTTFGLANGIPGNWDFASLLLGLISRRPTVFASALSLFPDLCSLAINVVYNEFKKYIAEVENKSSPEEVFMVNIILCCNPYENTEEPIKVIMPAELLQSSCVLLSIWFDEKKNDKDTFAIQGLVRMLMRSKEFDKDENAETSEDIDGLASARLVDTGKSAIPVESWVMLAKSRSDCIAKRAALTAPTGFLPRLLLCSGLPRASLLTMIDRLGKLGKKAPDMDKAFNQLLVPSASSEWDIGRLGHRREVSRKLLGRISAYFRMYNLSELDNNEAISFTFIDWLTKLCQSADKPSKLKAKKIKGTQLSTFSDIDSAETLFETMPNDLLDNVDALDVACLDGDASDMTTFLMSGIDNPPETPEKLDDVEAVQTFLNSIFEENNPSLVDEWLENNFRNPQVPLKRRRRRQNDHENQPKLGGAILSSLLLDCYIQLDRKVEGMASTLVKWVPVLSASDGSPELWKRLFAEGQKPSFLWENLVSRCSQTWNHTHVVSCRLWILSDGRKEKLDLTKVVRFLINGSTFNTTSVESFVDIPVAVDDSSWGRSEDTVRSATEYGLDCILASDYGSRLRSRNDLPEGLILLVLIARLGRKQVQFVSGSIMDRLQNKTDESRRWLLLSLLRLYAYFPFTMNLGVATLRASLTEAVAVCSYDWLSWRSPMDDSLQDMLNTALSANASPRSVQALADAAKKHPLLLLRKVDRMTIALEKDALALENNTGSSDKAGLIFGKSLDGPLEAKVDGKLLKIDVKHWGFNYTEQIWMVVLDVIAAVPNEVLFGCALKMGLTDLLDVYVRLVFIQSQLRTSDRFSKLKGRLSEFFGVFKASNNEIWDGWLASTNSDLASLGATRNIMMSCGFISHEEAMENIKKTTNSQRQD